MPHLQVSSPEPISGWAGPPSEAGHAVKAEERRAAAKPRRGCGGPAPTVTAPKGRASAAAKPDACLDGAQRWARACYEQALERARRAVRPELRAQVTACEVG